MATYRIATDHVLLTKKEGEELREMRLKAGLSAQHVSERIRINPTTVLTLERKGGRVSEVIRDKLIKCYSSY